MNEQHVGNECVILVRPGTSIFDYENLINGSFPWFALHIHPEQFTLDEALLWARQDQEERPGLPNYSSGPNKKVVFYSTELIGRKSVAKAVASFPQLPTLCYNYSHSSFDSEFKNFCDEIFESHLAADKFLSEEGSNR